VAHLARRLTQRRAIPHALAFEQEWTETATRLQRRRYRRQPQQIENGRHDIHAGRQPVDPCSRRYQAGQAHEEGAAGDGVVQRVMVEVQATFTKRLAVIGEEQYQGPLPHIRRFQRRQEPADLLVEESDLPIVLSDDIRHVRHT